MPRSPFLRALAALLFGIALAAASGASAQPPGEPKKQVEQKKQLAVIVNLALWDPAKKADVPEFVKTAKELSKELKSAEGLIWAENTAAAGSKSMRPLVEHFKLSKEDSWTLVVSVSVWEDYESAKKFMGSDSHVKAVKKHYGSFLNHGADAVGFLIDDMPKGPRDLELARPRYFVELIDAALILEKLKQLKERGSGPTVFSTKEGPKK